MKVIDYIQQIKNKQIVKAQRREIKSIMRYGTLMGRMDQYCRLTSYLGIATKDQKAIEIGCGPGKYVAMLQSLGYEVTGADPFTFNEWEIIRNEHIKFESGIYAENLPYGDDSFDCAVCLGALLYFNSPKDAFEEIKRVTKNNGVVVFRTVNQNNYYTINTGQKLDPGSKQLFTVKELLALLTDSGFVVEDYYTWGFWPSKYTNFWWWLCNVVLSDKILNYLSSLTPMENRINIIVKTVNIK